jgi:hypothetical protein
MPGIKLLLLHLFIAGFAVQSFAQVDMDKMDSIESAKKFQKKKQIANNAVLITPYYSPLFPVGELSNRFGFSNNIGMNISFKVKGNWLIGIEGDYLFGSHVKENPIAPILTHSTFQLIGSDGTLGDIPILLSGFEVGFRVGKLIPLSRKHSNSGIEVSLAPGFIQHKIWINNNANNFPQLDKTYKEGYDRLTNGPIVGFALGYQYLERKRFLSLYVGLDFAMGFTEERRNWNFDLMSADKHQRLDMLIGLRFAWIIPVFTNSKSRETYYY